MAEETLAESSVTDSVKLVEELDKRGDTPSNVLWYFFSDAEVWRTQGIPSLSSDERLALR